MDKTHQFSSFNEFWPYYLGEHRQAKSRLLHYLGTTLATTLLVFLIVQQQWSWLPIILLAGYAPAWVGHFFIEKNRPATFQLPWWSLAGDYKMLYFAATGRLKAELDKLPRH
jgi:hypothetical protein